MNTQPTECPNCKAWALLRKLSRLECSSCGYVEDLAAYEQSRADLSPQTKSEWGLIEIGVVLFGLYQFKKFLDGLA